MKKQFICPPGRQPDDLSDMPNRQCPECGGWEHGDGTEEADWNPCVCGEAGCDDYDPTPWCSGCGAMTRKNCKCGPIADNE